MFIICSKGEHMTILSKRVASYMENSSWIRRMFEAGAQLKARYGAENVYDFSLGNPDLPPPSSVAKGLNALSEHAHEPFSFGYMSNGGYPWAREKLAKHLSAEQGVSLTADNVILSCGAAGGLNAFFRAVLDMGEEVMAFSPYFVEYGFYAENHNASFRAVPTKADTFAPDLDALETAINDKTRVLIINSPNNPTGVVYSKQEIEGIIDVLKRCSEKFKKPIWLVADEPYRFLAFDGVEIPSVLPLYAHAVVVSSFSKNLSLPGERLGYVIISPLLEESSLLMGALLLTNRILGYVNPPVVGQHLMAAALGSQVDVNIYASRRNAMAKVLQDAGYEFQLPKGAFYFFPKAPGGDDVAFVNTLLEQNVLAVPGSGFGCKGHFRLAFCVDEQTIINAGPAFAKAIKQ